MAYSRKISKKSNSLNETEKNIDVVLDSISNGASIEVLEYWNKTEYIVSYPKGGRYKISKRIYDKLKAN